MYSQMRNTQERVSIRKKLNRNVIVNPSRKIKAMGLSSCQGLCITYHLHSKKFC